MKKPISKICDAARIDFKREKWVLWHTRIDYTSLVGVSIWDVGPAANHGYMKVSDALR